MTVSVPTYLVCQPGHHRGTARPHTLLMQSSVLDQVENAIVVLDKDRKVIYWECVCRAVVSIRCQGNDGQPKHRQAHLAGRPSHRAESHPSNPRQRSVAGRNPASPQRRFALSGGPPPPPPPLVSHRILLNEDKEIIGYIGVEHGYYLPEADSVRAGRLPA